MYVCIYIHFAFTIWSTSVVQSVNLLAAFKLGFSRKVHSFLTDSHANSANFLCVVIRVHQNGCSQCLQVSSTYIEQVDLHSPLPSTEPLTRRSRSREEARRGHGPLQLLPIGNAVQLEVTFTLRSTDDTRWEEVADVCALELDSQSLHGHHVRTYV